MARSTGSAGAFLEKEGPLIEAYRGVEPGGGGGRQARLSGGDDRGAGRDLGQVSWLWGRRSWKGLQMEGSGGRWGIDERRLGGVCRGGRVGLDAHQCFRCLITFPDEKFKERHMKREHPEDFIQANLRDALFLCFLCNEAFQSSQALICHQRSHASPSDCSDCLRPTFNCPDCGHCFDQLAKYQHPRLGHTAGHSLPHQCPYCSKSYRQFSNLRQHQSFHPQTQVLLPSPPYSCTECGESFSHETGLHEHYIRHARGEL